MRGLDPRIHPLRENLAKKMDCRVKPGNDDVERSKRLHLRQAGDSAASSLNPRRLSKPSGVGKRPRKAT
jgi:hypothetical protein